MRREFVAKKADRYEGIDGLKAYAIIGIALMLMSQYMRAKAGRMP